jgi:DNA-binding response OmpR family regulator
LFSAAKQEFKLGKLHFSYTDLKLEGGETTIKLKQKEADLLRFLSMHPNRILKREEILVAVWGKDDYFLGRSMDVFMSKLRKYLRPDPDIFLETIHGIGYRFSIPGDPLTAG